VWIKVFCTLVLTIAIVGDTVSDVEHPPAARTGRKLHLVFQHPATALGERQAAVAVQLFKINLKMFVKLAVEQYC